MSFIEFLAVWMVLVVGTIILSEVGGYSVKFGLILIFAWGGYWGIVGCILLSFGLWVLGHAVHRAVQVFRFKQWVADREAIF